MDFFEGWIDEHFMPHGHCYFWEPGVLWTNVIGDSLVALSYFTIPVLLVLFLRRRPDISFSNLFGAFAVFILACGLTHLLALISVWYPLYRLEGWVKIITAVVSVGTVGLLFMNFPLILRLPTNRQLTASNQRLEQEVIQHRQTLKELERKDRTLQSILRNAPVGMAIFSRDGRYQQVNGAFEQIFGYTEKEIYQRHFLDITHPDDIEESKQFYNHLLNNRESSAILEKRYITRSGEVKWVILNLSVVREEDGLADRWIAQYVDIDVRKQHEQLLARRSAALEDAVRLRTRELQEANADLENFVYAATHDLRSPLTNLQGLTEVLKEELSETAADHPNVDQVLKMIAGDTTRLDHLITDLLSFSRASRQEMKLEELNMNKLIEEVLGRTLPAYRHREVRIDLPELLPSLGDRVALQLVWENLISNALKYSHPRGPILLSFESFSRNRTTVYQLRDNGIGFDSSLHRDRLFQLFQRLHPNDLDYEGTGLGLAVVSRIIQKHGGTIWADSQPGAGAVFSFSLPDLNARLRSSSGSANVSSEDRTVQN